MKGQPMTVLERVRKLLIESSPMAICDDCIADRLDLGVRQHANHKARAAKMNKSEDEKPRQN